MTIQDQIIKIATKEGTVRTADVLKSLKPAVTRGYLSLIMSRMTRDGLLVKTGSTSKSVYALYKNGDLLGNVFKKHLARSTTKEHEVLDVLNRKVPFLFKLDENLRSILDFSFSEMLNNALEHSESKYIDIKVFVDSKYLNFTVSDLGIGVFKNVMKKRGLGSEFEAMQDILKGKTTTQPHAHSGEGIFFTSKMADIFVLESYGYSMRVDNIIPDIFFEQVKPIKKGTRVHFCIRRETDKHLKDTFMNYETDHEDPDFDKTEIHVKLYKIGTVYVSRSQARRISYGLEKFNHVVLNFEKVPTIGQAFADEIFRVFKNKYPNILITSINMNEAVKYMVNRASK